jgi:hypothetical protein
MSRVLLIHGGLWEDTGADWFWRRTGVVDGLAARGFTAHVESLVATLAGFARE